MLINCFVWILSLYAASTLHLLFPCLPSAYHFTSLSAIHTLTTLIIPHPFPFHLHSSTLSSVCSLSSYPHYNMCSISLKTPKDNSYFINSSVRDVLAKTRREIGSGEENEWGETERAAMRKLFHSIRRRLFFLLSLFQLYLLTEWAQ